MQEWVNGLKQLQARRRWPGWCARRLTCKMDSKFQLEKRVFLSVSLDCCSSFYDPHCLSSSCLLSQGWRRWLWGRRRCCSFVPRVGTVPLDTSAPTTARLSSKVTAPLLFFWMNTSAECFLIEFEFAITVMRCAGALFGDRVRCPFHGACFNINTGDIEEYPGLDCLPTYKVESICKHQQFNI